jgi:HK97 family phage major capsid protein
MPAKGKASGPAAVPSKIAGPMKPSAGLTEHVGNAPSAPAVDKPRHWKSFGEYLRAVANAGDAPGHVPVVDPQLKRSFQRLPSGTAEMDPSTGGFAVPPQFESKLIESLYANNPIAALVDRRVTNAPLGAGINLPAIDETSRADGSRSGGALAYWLAESATITTTFPKFRRTTFDPKKLIAVCPVSNELLADDAMLETQMLNVFSSELGFKLDSAILGTAVSGAGGGSAGTPLGLLNSPALITVPKDVGQQTKTITPTNIVNMWSRLPAPSRARACWLINEDVEAALAAISNAASQLFLPRGVFGNADPLLMGRPVYTIEQASVLGSVGDIVLFDPSQYVLVDGGIGSVLSAHYYWLSDQSVYRFVYRVDGNPLWASAITPFNSGSTRSPYVTLAAR